MSHLFGDMEKVWVVAAPLLLLLIFWFRERRRRAVLLQLVGSRLLPRMVVRLSPPRRWWKIILRCGAVLLAALAVMRPQWGEKKIELKRRGIDIVFAIDVSKSMLAEDVEPNRLERVRQDVRYFVENVIGQDRIGLVAFAGTARVLCPLTLDRGAFDLFLEDLDVSSISMGGTDVDAALKEAMDAFGDDERNYKAIVLFSDGEGHNAVPDETLAEIRRRGIRVYTVGIGSPEGTRIAITDDAGHRTYLKDRDGNIVLTRLNDRLLKMIAQKSLDGAYTHLAGGRKNLERIYRDNLAKIEERELKSRKTVRRIDRFQWFLAPALLLLMLEALIQEGARSRRAIVSSSIAEESHHAA